MRVRDDAASSHGKARECPRGSCCSRRFTHDTPTRTQTLTPTSTYFLWPRYIVELSGSASRLNQHLAMLLSHPGQRDDQDTFVEKLDFTASR